MPSTRHSSAFHAGLALAVSLALAGCARNVRIPDAPPPIDLEPVTPLAGFGMELRVWALDATSWKRTQQNSELTRLYEQWAALEAERTVTAQDPAPTATSDAAGPPMGEDTGPKTFEQFVQAERVASPERPGGEALARFAETRGSLDARAQEIWADNGVLFALVPIGQLADLRSAMGVPGPLERTWWGATTTWSHLAKGPAAGDRRVDTDLGPLSLGPGRLALVGRAWPAPGVGKPVLRVEFCPQFLPARAPTSDLVNRLNAADGPPDAFAQGPVFERMMLRGSLPKGYALVVVPAGGSMSGVGVGPDVPTTSLAQTLLSAVGPDGAARPVALVVVPVLPEWFSLDGR